MKTTTAYIADNANWASFYVQFQGPNAEAEAFQFHNALPKYVRAGYTPKANYVTLDLKLKDGVPSTAAARRVQAMLWELDNRGIPLAFRPMTDRSGSPDGIVEFRRRMQAPAVKEPAYKDFGQLTLGDVVAHGLGPSKIASLRLNEGGLVTVELASGVTLFGRPDERVPVIAE